MLNEKNINKNTSVSSGSQESSFNAIQPLFICLGVRKAATTWVHRQLEDHPQVACTTTKETGFWMKNYERGSGWYINQFPSGEDYLVYSEVTPHYLNKTALSRMANDLTNVRFMVVLRNPYERVFSEYLNRVRNGENKIMFSEMLTKYPDLVKHSQYATSIKEYQEYFPMEKLHVVLYDDIKENPVGVVQGMYKFIGVDSSFVSENLNKKVNVSRGYSKSDHVLKKLELFSKVFGLKRKHLVKLGLAGSLDYLYRFLARRNPPPILKDSEKAILDKSIRDEVLELEKLIGRDLSHWLN